MKPHNTTNTTIPEQFNRLPEPWRSKAVARCEGLYGKKLDEIDTIFHELDGKPFSFLSSAFTWSRTPEGHAVWEAISERGEFPPSDTLATTYRQLINERLPEPFRTQALENTPDRVLERKVRARVDLEPGFKFVSTLFTWSDSPQGLNYWSRVHCGDLSSPSQDTPTPEARLDILESRIAVLEGLVTKPEAPVCGEVAVDNGGDGYPSTPPDPGPGYRLLQKGDPIVRGKAEAWHPDEGWYLGPVRGWEGDTFDPDTDYWFREPAPPVDPGPGYRLVEKGELIEEGDEWFEDDGFWAPTELGGTGARKNIDDPLRRRVATPAYRLLNPGEIIRASDEVYLRDEWEEMAGDKGVGETFDPEEDHPIRRRIKSYEDA